MTNAIEQTKREMYEALAILKGRIEINYSIKDMQRGADEFESALEDHLEILRKAMVLGNETMTRCANQSLTTIRDLESRLAAMTANRDELARSNLAGDQAYAAMKQERDDIQLRLHAVDHAYREQQEKGGTCGQVCADRGASEQADGKTVDVLACAVTECQLIVTSWAVNGLRAKKAIRAVSAIVNGSPKVLQAMQDFEKADPGVCGYCDGLGYIHCNGGRPTAPCPSGCQ